MLQVKELEEALEKLKTQMDEAFAAKTRCNLKTSMAKHSQVDRFRWVLECFGTWNGTCWNMSLEFWRSDTKWYEVSWSLGLSVSCPERWKWMKTNENEWKWYGYPFDIPLIQVTQSSYPFVSVTGSLVTLVALVALVAGSTLVAARWKVKPKKPRNSLQIAARWLSKRKVSRQKNAVVSVRLWTTAQRLWTFWGWFLS